MGLSGALRSARSEVRNMIGLVLTYWQVNTCHVDILQYVCQSRYIRRLFFLMYGLKTDLASPMDETHKSDCTTLASAPLFRYDINE